MIEPDAVTWRLRRLRQRRHCQVVRSVFDTGRRDPVEQRDRWLNGVIAYGGHKLIADGGDLAPATDREGRAGRGRYVVVAGPDGVGKSTFADALTAALGDRPVDRYHHRLGVLPRRAASPVRTTRPHSLPPYATWLSVAKAAYLFADYMVGTALRVRPALRSGHWVILERGWWDIAVDPARYRLAGTNGLARRLGTLVPGPDLLVVLEAPPRTILARKSELKPQELERQLASWREVAASQPRSLVLDSSQRIDELVRVALAALEQPMLGV